VHEASHAARTFSASRLGARRGASARGFFASASRDAVTEWRERAVRSDSRHGPNPEAPCRSVEATLLAGAVVALHLRSTYQGLRQ